MSDALQSITLAGGSGFVGTHARRAFGARGVPLTVISRSPTSAGPHERVCIGALTAPDLLAGQLPHASVVINLAYDSHGGRDANLAMADGLVSICRDTGARRLVHVSTAVVVGVVDDPRVGEVTPCRPRTEYQRTKLDVERRLAEGLTGVCPVVVLRPAAVFGEGGLNLRKVVSDLTARSALENYLRACVFGRRSMNLVPVETVAEAIVFAATARLEAPLTTWIVADDDDPANNFIDVERVLRDALGSRPRVVPVLSLPSAILSMVLRATGRMSHDPRTRFSSNAIRMAGFVPPISFREALDVYARSARDANADAKGATGA